MSDRSALAASLLSELDAQPVDEQRTQLLMQAVRLLVGKGALQAPVIDTIAHAPATRLGMHEFIRQTHILDEIAANLTCDFHHVVFVEGRRCR